MSEKWEMSNSDLARSFLVHVLSSSNYRVGGRLLMANSLSQSGLTARGSAARGASEASGACRLDAHVGLLHLGFKDFRKA